MSFCGKEEGSGFVPFPLLLKCSILTFSDSVVDFGYDFGTA